MAANASAASARRSRSRMLLPSGAGIALALTGDLALYAVLPAYAERIGISLAAIGLLLSANRLVRFMSNPLVGLLASRFSRRRLVLFGLITGLLSTMLYVTGSYWLILLGRLAWGISWSIMYIGFYCMILDVTDEQDRGWGTGMLQTFYFAGIGFTPILGSLFSDWFGFTGGLLACALVQAFGLAIALIFQPETYTPGVQTAPRISVRESLHEAAERLSRFSFEWVRQHREFILANYLYMTTLFVGDGIIMSTISLYLQQRYGDTVALGGAGLTVTLLSGGLLAMRALISGGVAPLTGHWSDRTGSRWGAAGLGALISIAGCALLAVDGSFGLVVAGVVLAAFGSGMLLAIIPAIVSGIPGCQGSFAMGLLTTSGDVGSATAPLAGYALLKIVSLSMLYLVSAGLLVIGAVACLVAERRRG